MMMMMIDSNEDDNNDDDSDRTENYTPPPLDLTNDRNKSIEKENYFKDRSLVKEQSVMMLNDSFDRVSTIEPIDIQPQMADNYWDQWPLVNNEMNEEERLKLYSIPDIDIPPSPPPRPTASSSTTQSSTTTENNILDILTLPSSLSKPNRGRSSLTKKPVTKRKKKKKPMSEYRPPSPFSPKPDYKSMDIEQIKKHAMRYGLSTTQAKGRLIKILDEIYNVTHQYETDTDYEFEMNDLDLSKDSFEKKDFSHTPPTPAIIPQIKKACKRPAMHQMSSSDEAEENLLLPPAKKPTPTTTSDNDNDDQSDEDDANHEGRFLELTVHELSSTTSSSSSSIIGTPPTILPSNSVHATNLHVSPCLESTNEPSSQTSTNKKAKTTTSETDSTPPKKVPKKPKLQTPTMPLKDLIRSYIESHPTLHARILCYEPVDFEEFHKQIKTDLNLKIASKELMQCLDDQCITFTLRSRKGAFTSVMRAKRRQK